MTLFEFRVCRIGQGLLGLNRNDILDMPTRDFFYLWDAKMWAQPYQLEAQVSNRIVSAIINSGMIKDKSEAIEKLLIVDDEMEKQRVHDEIESLEKIGK